MLQFNPDSQKSIRIPADWGLLGAEAFMQAFAPDATANPLGIRVSRGGKITIGT